MTDLLPWRSRVTCSAPQDHDAEAGPRAHRARKACQKCPVTAECLDFALANDAHGIWANTNRRERMSLSVVPV